MNQWFWTDERFPAIEALGSYPEYDMPQGALEARDWPLILGLAVCCFGLRYLFTKLIVKPLVAKLYWLDDGAKRVMHMHICFTVYYLISNFFGYYLLWEAPWMPTRNWNISNLQYLFSFPDEHVSDFENISGFKLFYLCQVGFYIQSFLSMIFYDEYKTDVYEMIIHHLVVLFLLIGSISTNTHRLGSVILLLNDSVDVFVYLARVTKEFKLEWLTTFFFFLFTLVYTVCRMMAYPFLIYMSVFNRGYSHWQVHNTFYWGIKKMPSTKKFIRMEFNCIGFGNWCVAPYNCLVALKFVLWMIQIFWYVLMIRILFFRLVCVYKSRNINSRIWSNRRNLENTNQREKLD